MILERHCKVLYKILKNIPHEIGCEVGVHDGFTISGLLKTLPNIKRYYAIDPWQSYVKYNNEKYEKPGHKFCKTWEQAIMAFFESTSNNSHKVIIMRMKSVEASFHIEDESLDWVFIDANHEYEYIKENLELWTPKVKPGGLVAGHDYNSPKEKGKGWGITKAVDEFVQKNKLNIEPYTVWWFKK